jgi:hypothetical protein
MSTPWEVQALARRQTARLTTAECVVFPVYNQRGYQALKSLDIIGIMVASMCWMSPAYEGIAGFQLLAIINNADHQVISVNTNTIHM